MDQSKRRFMAGSVSVAAAAMLPARPVLARDTIKVGILHSLTGSVSGSERPMVDATQLAIAEINDSGGVLSRQLEPVVEDGASDWPTFAEKARKLLLSDKVAVVFGCYTSASRKAVLPVFEKNDGLLFYPTFYEGMEMSPNIMYTGADATQMTVPATRWLVQNRGKRFLLVGSDYLFPRATNAIVRKTLEQMGGSVADELYLSLDSSDFSSVIASIKRHKPEVILSTVVGGSNKPFFHQMNAAGIKGSNTAIMCLAVTEIEALDIGIDKMADVLSCMSYFQSLSRIRNQQFITAFKNRFGAQRVLNDPMESAYCAVHLWRKAAQRAAALGTAQVVAAAGGMDFSAPSGYVKLDQQNHHTWKYARIGKFARDGQVQVLYESPLIQPNPFFNT